MIRKAHKGDLRALTDLAEKQSQETQPNLGFDQDSWELQLNHIWIVKNGMFFVKEYRGEILGACGGPIVQWPYDFNIRVAQEYLAFGEPLFELRRYFYSWAMKQDCQAVIKFCIDDRSGLRTFDLRKRN